jgi:hypothetical protein
MSNIKKLMMSAAGGAGLNVEEVFSTYLYEGNGSNNTRSINNGLDLANEGGIIWTKNREQTGDHVIFDPQVFPDGDHWIYVNLSTAPQDMGSRIFDTTSTGYQISNDNNRYNASARDYVSWSFRKAPKFFDVVTWNGNNQSTRNISHNLGSVPGAMIVSGYTNAEDRWVYHRKMNPSAPQNYAAKLHENGGVSTEDRWRQTAPTDTQFTVDTDLNTSGRSYFAYLFAHNDGDGGHGPDGQQDIIKCGSFTTNSSGIGEDVNLGWEPQWLLVRSITYGDWKLVDTTRGYPAYKQGNSATQRLEAEDTASEATQIYGGILSNTGFKIQDNANTTYMYIAIRRGPMAVPEDATEVFDPIAANNSAGTFNTTGFRVDFQIMRPYNATRSTFVNDRMRGVETLSTQTGTSGPYLLTNTAASEVNNYMTMGWTNDGFRTASGGYPSDPVVYYNLKRAPNFFEMVTYTGNAPARTINLGLGSVPKMMWIKCRDGGEEWCIYHSGAGATKFLTLNQNYGTQTSSDRWNNTTPTDTQFSLGNHREVNRDDNIYIAYLFGEVSGISKMGSYTGNGQAQVIDCGFTAGARFVMIKRTNTTGDWYYWDVERGIVTGSESRLAFNLDAAEVTNTDFIDPNNSGFALQAAYTAVNNLNDEYIFYAIA